MKRRLPRWWPRDRRQAQSGATLVELLVAVVIMGLALTLIIGTFSTGLLDSAMGKRNTAGLAVVQYELDRISSSAWSASPQQFSDCFATEDTTVQSPAPATSQGGCPSTRYTLLADVTVTSPGNYQVWSITVTSWPNGARVGSTVQTIKVNR
ncbi:MAG TPA: prepilin-type N-terminal cleavage/methylation domain-containing protein [Candidatus Acidoferrum sp.]|nr:prepilin-type N-terminal cleavage/methylation domain-containing protein [Candidatus Acidoferrum sp.]